MAVECTFFPYDDDNALVLAAGVTATVEAAAASAAWVSPSNPSELGLVRVVAVGADFRVAAGPSVTNGTGGLRIKDGLPEVFVIREGDKIGVSAV